MLGSMRVFFISRRTERSKLQSVPTQPQLISRVPKLSGQLEVSQEKPVAVTTEMSPCICSSWPWSRTSNLSVSGLAFKWKRWSASLSESTSQLPLQHGFHVSSFVSTKWSEVLHKTPGLPSCVLKPTQHPTTHPLSSLLNSATQPFPLLTCYKTSKDFSLLIEDVHCHISGRLEVQWIALEWDHKSKHVRQGRLPMTSLLETPGALPNAVGLLLMAPRLGVWLRCRLPCINFYFQDKTIVHTSGPDNVPETTLVLGMVSFIASISQPTCYFKMCRW